MILEAIAITSLAVSVLSETERRRIAAMAALGQWSGVLNRMGIEMYLQYVSPLPPGAVRDAATAVLIKHYRSAARAMYVKGSNIEFEPELATVLFDPTFDGGDPVQAPVKVEILFPNESDAERIRGAFVLGWARIRPEDLTDLERDEIIEDDGYIEAARRMFDNGTTIRFSWDAFVQPSIGMADNHVCGWYWVSEADLLKWAYGK